MNFSFLSPDAIVANPFASQDYNRYSYCRNNPLMYTDPSGNHPWLIGIAAIVGTWVAVDLLIFTSDFLNNGSAPDAWRKTLTYNYIVEPLFPNRANKGMSERRMFLQSLEDLRKDPVHQEAAPNNYAEFELEGLARLWFPDLMQIIDDAGVEVDFKYGYPTAAFGVTNKDKKNDKRYKVKLHKNHLDKEYLLCAVIGHELYHVVYDILGMGKEYKNLSKNQQEYKEEIKVFNYTKTNISRTVELYFGEELSNRIIVDCEYWINEYMKLIND
ncbi:MAG: hypothetical protein SNJ71_06830 [Bacteroidales bacterium]